MTDQNSGADLRLLPSIDALLRSEEAKKIVPLAGAKHAAILARAAIDALRRELSESQKAQTYSREELFSQAATRLENHWRDERNLRLRRVINATGVIVHTNLGRAPLSENARRAILANAAGYCNLEFDTATGKRGKRGIAAETLLAELTGAEAALIVNNCAAATLLILNVFAKGGEAIVSRGELVEIGGDFRIPDVMAQSGATLREVGATNRSKIADYERAINDETRLILRVHPSNFRIVGFTAAPALSELAELARHKSILLYEDAGSGALIDLSRYGISDEPIIADSVKAGADIVSFSGDKLLGGVQAGLIVGRGELIEQIRRHPLYRALRADKLIYAALEATLEAFRRETALREIPVLRMLSMPPAEIEIRAKNFARRLKRKRLKDTHLNIEIIKGNSVVGGGSAPTVQPATVLLALTSDKMSAADLEQKLRISEPPVITRILDDKVLIDLRTVAEGEETELLEILTGI